MNEFKEREASNCGLSCTELTGEAAVTVRMRAYNATGEVTRMLGTVPQGTRVLFTCDVEGLPEGQVAVSYTWYLSSTSTGRSEIQEDDPYHTAVNDTLLVDTTSWGRMRKHYVCEVDTVNDFFTLRLTGWCIIQTCRQ